MADERVYGPHEFGEWGRSGGTGGCVVVGCGTRDRRPIVRSYIEIMHVSKRVGGGMGRKGDWRNQTVFGCWRHHDEQGDRLGNRLFSEKYDLQVCGDPAVDLEHAAQLTTEHFDRWHGGLSE